MATAIVTGAGRGIGRATALALADAGFSLGLVARSAAELDETKALVVGRGARAAAVSADVTDLSAVRAAVEEIEEAVGPISAVVNNAGSLRALGPIWEVAVDDWWEDVRTSLGGAFNVCREVLPPMLKRGGGRIVNVASYTGTRPAPYQTAYGCAKAAVVNLTESLAASGREHGIAAFAVAPGFTQTEMTRHLTESDAGRRWLPEAGTGRVVEAEDSAALIMRLLRGDADALSGRLLHTLDDIDALLMRIDEVRHEELYVPRVRRLPGT